MVNIYEQISRNKIRSTLIISLFSAFIVLVAYLITRAYNLDGTFIVFALLFSIISSLGSYFYGDKMVLAINQAQPANKNNYPLLYQIVENLSIVNQTPMPKIYIISTNAPNAFATGRDPDHAVVCVTTGLLPKLNRSQLEAVIAHELSHIKNYDIRLMTIVSILIGSLSILINIAYRSTFFRKNDNKENNQANTIIMLLGFVMIIFAPLIAQLIQLAISRRREYFADASAVKLTRQPQALIDALTKISADDSVFETASTATASLYIVNPFKGNKIASLFSTHPPIKDRIKALESMM
jgi:heat shock protein HtpX